MAKPRSARHRDVENSARRHGNDTTGLLQLSLLAQPDGAVALELRVRSALPGAIAHRDKGSNCNRGPGLKSLVSGRSCASAGHADNSEPVTKNRLRALESPDGRHTARDFAFRQRRVVLPPLHGATQPQRQHRLLDARSVPVDCLSRKRVRPATAIRGCRCLVCSGDVVDHCLGLLGRSQSVDEKCSRVVIRERFWPDAGPVHLERRRGPARRAIARQQPAPRAPTGKATYLLDTSVQARIVTP